MKNTHEIFVREFPENFKACMDCKDFDIEAFYKLIDEHPEILINCEDKFFELVKQHVENNVGGLTHTLMFNWNWASIYGILSSNTVKNFVQETKSSAFEKMVLAIARPIDLIQDQRQQMAILFFKNAAGFIRACGSAPFKAIPTPTAATPETTPMTVDFSILSSLKIQFIESMCNLLKIFRQQLMVLYSTENVQNFIRRLF